MVTQDDLKGIVKYRDGYLVRLYNTKGAKAGSMVGCKLSNGYIQGVIKGKKYLVHRLIFLYHYGYMPKYIDHINCIRSDNRIENLREASNENNKANSSISSLNTSGIKGLFYHYPRLRWIAQVRRDSKIHNRTFSGSPNDVALKEKAIEWLHNRRIELHGEFTNHG